MGIAEVLQSIADEKRVQQQSRYRELALNGQLTDLLIDEGLDPPVEDGDPVLVCVGTSLFEIRSRGPRSPYVASVKTVPVISSPEH